MVRQAWFPPRLPEDATREGSDDRTIVAILRHSNITLTQNTRIKSVFGSQVAAVNTLETSL